MSQRSAEQFNPSRKNNADNLTTGDYPGHHPYGVRKSAGGGAKAGPPIGVGFLVTGTGQNRATGGKFSKVPSPSGNKMKSGRK